MHSCIERDDYYNRGSTLLVPANLSPGPLILTITESPDPIKDHSEMVFRYHSCKALPPYVPLSERS